MAGTQPGGAFPDFFVARRLGDDLGRRCPLDTISARSLVSANMSLLEPGTR